MSMLRTNLNGFWTKIHLAKFLLFRYLISQLICLFNMLIANVNQVFYCWNSFRTRFGYIVSLRMFRSGDITPNKCRPGGTFLKSPGTYFHSKRTGTFCEIYQINPQKAPGHCPVSRCPSGSAGPEVLNAYYKKRVSNIFQSARYLHTCLILCRHKLHAFCTAM